VVLERPGAGTLVGIGLTVVRTSVPRASASKLLETIFFEEL